MRELNINELAPVSGGQDLHDEIIVEATIRFTPPAGFNDGYTANSANDYGAEPTDEEILERIDAILNGDFDPNDGPDWAVPGGVAFDLGNGWSINLGVDADFDWSSLSPSITGAGVTFRYTF